MVQWLTLWATDAGGPGKKNQLLNCPTPSAISKFSFWIKSFHLPLPSPIFSSSSFDLRCTSNYCAISLLLLPWFPFIFSRRQQTSQPRKWQLGWAITCQDKMEKHKKAGFPVLLRKTGLALDNPPPGFYLVWVKRVLSCLSHWYFGFFSCINRVDPKWCLFFLIFKIYFIKKKKKYLAVLGLRCCMWIFSSCGEWGYSSFWWSGFLSQWLLLLQNTGSRCTGFSNWCEWAQ